MASLYAVSLLLLCLCSTTANKPHNVLLVIADDLRPALGCYGEEPTPLHTPNLDRFAAGGALFLRAHAQIAVCGPSRTSFLTSRRPDSLKTYDNRYRYWREFAGNFTTIPQYFREHGYHTLSVGKVFHNSRLANKTDDRKYSWSEMPFHPSTQQYKNARVCHSDYFANESAWKNIVCPVNVSEQPERSLPDIQSALFAADFLRRRAASLSKPFFLALGFHKPHVPLKYPRQYKDAYPLFTVPIALNWQIPMRLPDVAMNPWTDMRGRDDIGMLNVSFPYGPIPPDYQALIRQSYYASVSYIDALFGYVMQELESAGLRNNTVVVFTSDHGWSMGEHGMWSKYSNFGITTRVPLLIQAPDMGAAGQRLSDLVELVDLLPTLADLAGLPPPPICSAQLDCCTEGVSVKPLLLDSKIPWKSAIFTQYPRPSYLPQENSDQPKFVDIRVMGYSIRTRRFRYTEWIKFDPMEMRQYWHDVYARELYDLLWDIDENDNVAMFGQYEQIVSTLSRRLRKGWKDALPK